MKRIVIFCLVMLMFVSFAGCAALEQTTGIIESTEATTAPETSTKQEVTTEPEPTEETLPSFEECRVLTYYFQETIPYSYYGRYGKIQILEGTKVHLWIYDTPCYRGDDVRNLVPGDLLILGDREILIETVEIDNANFNEETFVINGGEGVDGVWLRPFTFYNVETKQTEIDYSPCNSNGWSHFVLTEERDVGLSNKMYLINTMTVPEDMDAEDFVKDLEAYSDTLYLHNTYLDMVDGKLEGIHLLSGIDNQTYLPMIPDGYDPIDPDRLHFLMTGEKS